jgi:hypothetical protein
MEEIMSASAWLAKLNLSPETACRCGHPAKQHLHGKSCGTEIENFKFCKCDQFREVNSNQIGDDDMAKKERTKKPKGEGRIPTLAPYAETLAGKTIYMNHDDKEHTATVLTSGVIRMNDKDYTSPSSAGSAILGKDKKGKPRQIDGWKSWYFNKDGSRVMLNTLRGSKSPLTLKAPKPRKAKAAKANGSVTAAKRVRKPRATKLSTAQVEAASAVTA